MISFSAYYSLKLCLPFYAEGGVEWWNEVLHSQKFHLLLLGNSNMLHGPNNHMVYQSGFHNHNQCKVYLLFGCSLGKLGLHILLQLLFLKTSVFLWHWKSSNLLSCKYTSIATTWVINTSFHERKISRSHGQLFTWCQNFSHKKIWFIFLNRWRFRFVQLHIYMIFGNNIEFFHFEIKPLVLIFYLLCAGLFQIFVPPLCVVLSFLPFFDLFA